MPAVEAAARNPRALLVDVAPQAPQPEEVPLETERRQRQVDVAALVVQRRRQAEARPLRLR
jgi:hypothetical protein